jgi:hypothetical protein
MNPPFFNLCELFLFLACGGLLGCFEGVDLGFFALDLHLHMGRKVTDSALPFLFRGWIGTAYFPYGAFDDPVAPFTIFNYYLTGTLRKYASLFPPESALLTG